MYGRLNANMALNRPTFAVSVWNDIYLDTAYPPSKAVDGNKDTDLHKVDHSCFVTNYENNPWWVVDLGSALAVAGVLFTNRRHPDYGTLHCNICDGTRYTFSRSWQTF